MPKIKKPHAFINRIHVRLGFALALVCGLPVTAQAAYATLTPPPGWTAGSGGLATYQTPAASAWTSSKALTDAVLRQASATSKIRVSLAINSPAASRFLAGRIGVALATGAGTLVAPGLTVAALLALPVITEWWSQSPYKWDSATQTWTKTIEENCDPSGTGCREYFGQIGSNPERVSTSKETVCRQLAADIGYAYEGLYSDGCLIGGIGRKALQSRVVPKKGGKTVTVPYEEVEPSLVPLPLKPNTPNIVWPLSWPVDSPIINPGTDNKPKPLFFPTGRPVKNPKYDPSKPISPSNSPTIQPGVRVVPSPTADDPWRVDIEPVDRPVDETDPNAPTEPDLSDDPDQTDDDQPKSDDEKSLCEKHPDILACAKPDLDTPDEDIPKSKRDVTFTEENLFGGGACPADVYFQPSGGLQQMKAWDWNQSCGYITGYVKPILILCCTFTAFMILVPGKTE